MALEGINTAQYDAFVSFARANLAERGGKSVARLAEGGAARAISAADPGRDGVHKFWRGGDEKTKNDQTRRVFRQAVADLFGGEAQIPPGVKKAMLLGDYDKGKPLTARRIESVRLAVERHFAGYSQAFARARQSADEVYRKFGKDDVDAAVSQALAAVVTDPDATNLVIANLRLLLVRDNATMRPADEVREKAKAILANVKELRTLAKGDHAVFNAGLNLLERLQGKALPPGAFRNIFNAVKRISVRPLENIHPGCGPVRLHKAFRAFVDMTQNVVDRSGAGVAQQLALYRVPLRTFVGHLIAAKCDQEDLQSLHDTLHGPDGETLYLFYQDLADRNVEYDAEDPMDKFRMDVLVAESNLEYGRFDSLIAEAVGVDMADYGGLDFEGEFEHSPEYAGPICQDFLATIAKNPEAYELQ